MSYGHYAGEFKLGDELIFHIASRDDLGATEGTFNPTHYDVIEIDGDTTLDLDVAMVALGNYTGDIWTPDPAALITLSIANDYKEGGSYVIIVKEGTGIGPSIYKTIGFRIDNSNAIEADTELIIDVETADATLEGTDTLDNTLLGRLMTIERNQYEVIFPRLKRALGLLGEHQLVDGFQYDDDANITQCRVRIFEDDASMLGASIWRDADTDADPASSPESGELKRYLMGASHATPRNLRTVYTSSLNTASADNDFIDGSDGSVM